MDKFEKGAHFSFKTLQLLERGRLGFPLLPMLRLLELGVQRLSQDEAYEGGKKRKMRVENHVYT